VENYILLENQKKYCGQMIASSVILSLIFFLVLFPSHNSYARVTGPCSNCHTMHNSQEGDSVEGFMAFEDDGTANRTLLATTCVGCHTGENTADSTTPYVMGLSKPDFGKDGNTLAGGNFWWVAQGGSINDKKGHNVAGITISDNNLNSAPGQTEGFSRSCRLCHSSLEDGCKNCHRIPKHHANDGTGTKLVNTAEQGWYRFLSGHMGGIGRGVEGIEHEKWNYKADEKSHNEYLGKKQHGEYGFDGGGNTTTAFCTGCHGQFIHQQSDAGKWIRHPSDAVICDPDNPDSENSEYATAFGGVYDPDVPVARPSLDGWTTSSNIVTPGEDMVMCLSCHVAHGSPYPDMLRWDYDLMIAGTTNPAVQGTGCFKCHTEKDGED